MFKEFKKFKDVNEVEIVYEYIEHQEFNSVVLERQYLQNYSLELVKLIHEIENCEDFNKNISKLCDYCDYQEHCSQN